MSLSLSYTIKCLVAGFLWSYYMLASTVNVLPNYGSADDRVLKSLFMLVSR